jgi:hypothetical protein
MTECRENASHWNHSREAHIPARPRVRTILVIWRQPLLVVGYGSLGMDLEHRR